ncbi:type III-B CRISPR module RAMP protein Cmr1 [Paenibacillus taiwanensis]|uniref:type III-B CRISPR module RAMP protein Cmr1 n=1 Tax=Paenibacillus taiwanensis TaxID=401638 RepID=UPI0004257A62|nr:type III-B CRISPR module RAMP protein Cmr1 [Paenibacillus taiwanensis]
MSEQQSAPIIRLTEVQARIGKIQQSYASIPNKECNDCKKCERCKNTRTQEYQIELITPMFGDTSLIEHQKEVVPVRSAAIRGHLRFWWRATRGAAYTSVYDLREREVAIFGDTTTPSRVKISIEMDDKAEKLDAISAKRLLPYVLFPLRETDTPSSSQLLQPFSFRLYIQYSLPRNSHELTIVQLKEEVEAALSAWIHFGGLGGRTRRGCGSLYCKEFSIKRMGNGHVQLQNWYSAWMTKHKLQLLPRGEYRQWPTLCNEIYSQVPSAAHVKEPKIAWKDIILVYQLFRQQRNKWKQDDSETCKFARSLWPEADSIRQITGMAVEKHSKICPGDKIRGRYAFPRAQLGLPIIFKFKSEDCKAKYPLREPYNTELAPVGKTRLASPLILKPIAIDNKKAIGAIVLLNHKPLSALQLQTREKYALHEVENKLKHTSISHHHIYPNLTYSRSPMKAENETATTCAIAAFLSSVFIKNWMDGKQNNHEMRTYNSSPSNKQGRTPSPYQHNNQQQNRSMKPNSHHRSNKSKGER